MSSSKDAADSPHLNCGSIHAPDGEMALLNARDVFVRRPDCVSLWVAPAARVAEVTVDGLADLAPRMTTGGDHWFTKSLPKPPPRASTRMLARSLPIRPAVAFRKASEAYQGDVWVWLVVP